MTATPTTMSARLEAFRSSDPLTIGVELELQIIELHHYDLSPGAADLLRLMKSRTIPGEVKPEITNSMIELSTGVCRGYRDALEQLREIRDALVDCARLLNVGLSGGGTHAFQDWSKRRIYDEPRFIELSALYGYLTKQFTVFGQHVHIGCASPGAALTLLHQLSRFIPQFIALSASSPFVQGHDTGYHSARLNSVSAFPLSGRAPLITDWETFGAYFDKMTGTGVVRSMKDFYWDIRPKPEFGTIEVRVLDTPLTIEKAAGIAAYIQCVAAWLQAETPFSPAEDDYLVYSFNRFQACRHGFDAGFVDPQTHEHRTLRDDILATLVRIEPHAIRLGAEDACRLVRDDVTSRGNDASWIRATYESEQQLGEVVRQQCLRWGR
ncbi:MAG: YbdK family carboxylate-amine ligase [Burkholderiaceae bacterium]